jgi:hypothetical protein
VSKNTLFFALVTACILLASVLGFVLKFRFQNLEAGFADGA